MASSIYTLFDDQKKNTIAMAIQKSVKKACDEKRQLKLFFRADDIAAPYINYHRMMALFLRYRVPLCLAVVPTWITRARWESMKPYRKEGGNFFCWHLHGYRHQNHELTGKKQEFGPGRSRFDISHDLVKGYSRLESILGNDAFPVFTPPWNRCSKETMQELKKMGFKAISRSHGAQPEPPQGLKDVRIHVDLHTRKDTTPQLGWEKLLKEFQNGIESGTCGIMIHHMQMNEAAFTFLELLLELFSKNPQLEMVNYRDLV